MQFPMHKKEHHDQNIENQIEEKIKRLFPFGEDTATSNRIKRSKGYINETLINMESCTSGYDTIKHTREQLSETSDKEHIPLVERLKPTTVATYVGQKQVIGPDTMLNHLLERKEIPSMIFWGPHGCGKTSLTNVIVHLSERITDGDVHIVNLSASKCGVKSIRDVVTATKDKSKLGCKTIVFMDEIHNFNKLQQDIFLPHIEAGTFTLIGCTTENPSYSLNPALLSRCRVFMLNKLTESNIKEILHRAIENMKGSILNTQQGRQISTKEQIKSHLILNPKFYIDNSTIEWLAEASDGDARVALHTLELAALAKKTDRGKALQNNNIITMKDVQENIIKAHTLSEKDSDQSQHMYCALHKSIRAGKTSASLYWIARIMAAKEDPVNIARRLVRISSEDIGLADPDALGIAVDTMYGCQTIGMPECDVLLGQCTLYLAKASKSRSVYNALKAAKKVISEHIGPQPTVPLHMKCNSMEPILSNSPDCDNDVMRQATYIDRTYLPKEIQHINLFEKA